VADYPGDSTVVTDTATMTVRGQPIAVGVGGARSMWRSVLDRRRLYAVNQLAATLSVIDTDP
jgi:hypothetical protein